MRKTPGKKHQLLRQPNVILITKRDCITRAKLNGLFKILPNTESADIAIQQYRKKSALPEFFQYLPRIIIRCVVANHQLYWAMGLMSQARQLRTKKSRTIASAKRNGNVDQSSQLLLPHRFSSKYRVMGNARHRCKQWKRTIQSQIEVVCRVCSKFTIPTCLHHIYRIDAPVCL